MEGWVFLLVLIIPVILLIPSLAERLGRTFRNRHSVRVGPGTSPGGLAAICPGCRRPVTSFQSVCPHCSHPVAEHAQPVPGGPLVDRPWMPLLVTLLVPILLFLFSAIVLVFLLGGMPGVGGTGG